MCDTSKGVVGVDGVVGGVLGIGAIAAADSSSGAALVLGLAATAYIAAAVHGNGVVDECNDASFAWERDYGGRPPLAERQRVAVDTSVQMRPPQAPFVPPPPMPPPPAPSVVEKDPAPQPATPAPAQAKPNESGEWSSFWEEVP